MIATLKSIDATGTKSFAAALGRLPGTGESVHMIIGFRHSMGDLLPAVMRLSGQRIVECFIATLTYSKQNAADWCSMLDSIEIGKLSVIVSHYFAKTSPQIYDSTVPTLRTKGAIVTPVRCHAKLLLCKLAEQADNHRRGIGQHQISKNRGTTDDLLQPVAL